MKVTAIKDFAKSITKGNHYEVITEKQLTFVVVDDQGFYLGLSKEYFEEQKEQMLVDWFIEQLAEYFPHGIAGIHLIIEQAKQMENAKMLTEWQKGYLIGLKNKESETKYPSGMPG